MVYFALGAFAITFLNVTIFIFAFRPSRLTPTVKTYFQWSFFASLWALGYGITLIGFFDYNTTLFWNKFCQAMATLIGPFFFKLACLLSNQYQAKRNFFNTYLFIGIVIAVTLFLTDWIVQGLWSFHFFKYHPLGGPLYGLFVGFFSWCNLHAFIIVLKECLSSQGLRRKQLKLFLISTGIGYGLSAELFLQGFGVPIDPHGVFFMFSYSVILGYAILRYRFLDIEVIIKKTLVFAGLFGVFMMVVGSVTALTQSFIGQYFKMGMMANGLMCALIVALLYNPTYKFLINITDKYLFQKKEDFKVTLNRLSKNIITILDLHEVGATVLQTLRESLRLETGALILRDEKNNHYDVLNSFNLNSTPRTFPRDSEFIRYFSAPEKIINLEEGNIKHRLPNTVVEHLETLKAVICVPLYVQGELIGLLTMGKKKSDQEFTQEEIDYLPAVASQTAIALKNAQLVDDVIREREEKIKAQNKAETVNYASSLSHETGNALVGITSTPQNISEGFVKDLRKLIKYCENKLDVNLQKRYEKIADKIYRFAKTIEQNSEKIRIIIKTATGGLKDNRSEKEEVSFRFVWNHAKKEANINDVRYDGNLPDPFTVFGNTSLLTRVLVNFFINSRDAMANIEGDDKCIHLDASYRVVDGREVGWIEYWDDGPGIPEELFEKVFKQGFTTKAKPQGEMGLDSGYGQGLYYCQKFIEGFHRGRIWLEKKDSYGSKFIFWIPATVEKNGKEYE